MKRHTNDEIHEAVRTRYADVAESQGKASCCEPSCCGGERDAAGVSRALGYSDEELGSVPDGANLGLGCGNPLAIASLRPGEVVLDLGSGAGFDCFLAARAVGGDGFVIGVDMTEEMVARARGNAAAAGIANVEFRLGRIEALPVDDTTVDVLMSNCVINLSPDKPAVYREAFRVLKPGGRLAISDIVTTAFLPEHIRDDTDMLTGCIAGASSIDEVASMLRDAGFADVRVEPARALHDSIRRWVPGTNIGDYIASATIRALRP